LDRKKLRKRAVNSLKSFPRVDLCAGPFARPGWRFRQARTSACVSARQKQPSVSRGQSRAVSTPSIGSESGRTTVESWRFVKGLRLVSRPRTGGANPPPCSLIWALRGGNFSPKALINLERNDYGRFGAKSSDNYATSSGKPRLKPSL
jgi:hypothetical protein